MPLWHFDINPGCDYTCRMSGEISPYGLRMPPDLRARLQKEADLVGRSLNAEIVARLWESVTKTHRYVSPVLTDGDLPAYRTLSDMEHAMLTVFRRWPVEKQLSFLVLFK